MTLSQLSSDYFGFILSFQRTFEFLAVPKTQMECMHVCSQFELLQHIVQFKKLAVKSWGAPKISLTSCRLLKYCTLVQFLQYFTQIINIANNFILLHYISDNAIAVFLHLFTAQSNKCFHILSFKELLKPPKGTTLQCNSSILKNQNNEKRLMYQNVCFFLPTSLQ